MSVTAYYARMSGEEVEALKADPKLYWQLDQMPWDLAQVTDVGSSECLDLGKDWEILSWLCSTVGRAEARNEAAMTRVMLRREQGEHFEAQTAFHAALAQEARAMGFEYVNPEKMPEDLVLKAIQGRRKGDSGPSIADLGLAAAAFTPEEVRVLADTLNGLSEDSLSEHFDISEMMILDLPGDGEESELDEFILPQLRRLQTLYNRAAAAGQHVVVVVG